MAWRRILKNSASQVNMQKEPAGREKSRYKGPREGISLPQREPWEGQRD